VNAGLELIGQIEAGVIDEPRVVVVPLGTGGTAAGLALAFAIAQKNIDVIGARVVPRIVAHARRVLRLANETAKLIERTAKVQLPRVRTDAVKIVHESYGGAYGRETEAAKRAAEQLRTVSSIELDSTYSANAFATALDASRHSPTLFWLTFDSRTLTTP